MIELFQWWFQFQDGRKEIVPYMWVGPFFICWKGPKQKLDISLYLTPN